MERDTDSSWHDAQDTFDTWDSAGEGEEADAKHIAKNLAGVMVTQQDD